ncbi:MAG TPA: S41 family peptidase [Gemmatimonadaceae bacterium]|nr:S41 family peptidase [Gemmatimonadaceae bacterium]
MDYIGQLGALVLDHRFRRLTEHFLRVGEECYAELQLPFRARWASTFLLLEGSGPLGITEIADALKLTHPAVIGITDEMRESGIVSSSRDRDDGRRRAIALTAKGRSLSKKLHALWSAMSQAQRHVFAEAECDILAVLDRVDARLAERPLSDDILRRVRGSVRGKTRVIAAATALLLAVSTARPAVLEAQPTVDANVRAAVVRAIADSLVGGYIYEDRARVIAESLSIALGAGAFNDVHQPFALGVRLTEFLRRLANDKHLSVGYSAAAPDGAPARVRVRRPAGGESAAAAETHGLENIAILPGNIGYVDIWTFSGDPAAAQRVDSMMAAFANVSALVIDLRRNIGGGPEVIRHLSTYFFDKRTHLVSSIMRGMPAPQERWTLEHVPHKRLTSVPVYLLTSRRTISAGESFVFGLKTAGRVTVVGERTAGGGHFGRIIPLVAGYTMFLPVGRTYDPRSNQGWEAQGIVPDVEVNQEDALERALELIRNRAVR